MDTTSTFDLAPGSALGLSHAAGRELLVFSGRLWVTCDGGSQDLFLSAGDRLRLGPGAVIECDSPGAARLQLLPAHGRLWWAAALTARALARLALRLQGVQLAPAPRRV
ncbi:DUF2917 domain-containing protein [Azohydromonas caseinilytica]|uniref:DUF2917 domain-containing protein n=1 Tax=Azohydromonas caseinilytica TaxID=2728836 RepID=A0A848FDX4_9BURK|nr:DUF2917 domain-containing protein [Azohydromonas caseinilytica]NML17644.1 DUF2917 domain-containing protein [Azohydromonas caseinilytica]